MSPDDTRPARPRRSRLRRLLLNRLSISMLYLRGRGIEIGALHNPLRVPPWARVSYVDRMTATALREQYPELRGKKLVPVDVVDDGERLATIADGSQDFVIANHFVEHCENPILALQNMLRVLRPGGVVFLALPDKRYTFDRDRPVTGLEHLLRDFREGPDWSRRGHFEEWVRHVNGVTDEREVAQQVDHLLAIRYSIHFHAWTQREMVELLQFLRGVHPCDLDLMFRCGDEVIFIVRNAPADDPAGSSAPDRPGAPAGRLLQHPPDGAVRRQHPAGDVVGGGGLDQP